MVTSTSILHKFSDRRKFDPSKHEDLLELKFFVEKGKWREGCPFMLEFPWDNVPDMCKNIYVKHTLASMK